MSTSMSMSIPISWNGKAYGGISLTFTHIKGGVTTRTCSSRITRDGVPLCLKLIMVIGFCFWGGAPDQVSMVPFGHSFLLTPPAPPIHTPRTCSRHFQISHSPLHIDNSNSTPRPCTNTGRKEKERGHSEDRKGSVTVR